MTTNETKLNAALNVLLYNSAVWEELINNDPNAYRQAIDALTAGEATKLITYHMKQAAGAII